jgi:4-amino-4-deoxy-L-arabinose transferase-like glycosyltransferase
MRRPANLRGAISIVSSGIRTIAPDTPPGPPSWTVVSTATFSLLAVAATALRFLFLARKRFWFDECFSAEMARLPLQDFGKLLWRREANMSLYYCLLRGWLHFGSSPFFIRSLSVILSLAALPAVFWLARELFDRRVALLSVALMSFNTYHIRYAQEARSYSLFVLLATISSGFFVATLRHPSRRNEWAYILASTLAVYAHLYALLLLVAQWLSVRRLRGGRESLRRAWTWIGIAALPLIVFAAKTGAGPIRWIQRPGLHDLLAFSEHLAGNDGLALLLLYATACAVAVLYRRDDGATQGIKPILVPALDGTAKALTFPIYKSGEMLARNAWQVHFLLIWLIVPPGAILLLSLARPLFLGRYFIFCLPPLTILAAAGVIKLRKPWLTGAILALMLLLSLHGTFSYYDHDFDLDRDDSAGATNYTLDHAQPGDAILFHIAEGRVPYEFFKSIREGQFPGERSDGPEIIYPQHGDRLDYRDFTGTPTRDFVQSVSGRYRRVWLILMSNGTPDRPDPSTLMLDEVLDAGFPRAQSIEFSGVEVRLYSRP